MKANNVPKHRHDCRSAQAGADIPATHVSLDSLSVHRLQPGHYVAPLLWAGSTSLPFAAGLELFSGSCNEYGMGGEDFSLPELPESDGLLSLQYILDGRAQVILRALICIMVAHTSCRFQPTFGFLCHTQMGKRLFHGRLRYAPCRCQVTGSP